MESVALVQAIYDEAYAERYPSLYLAPWGRKHRINEECLSRLLAGLGLPMPSWLDLACGQAWHFSRFAGRARMVGLDASDAQLARALRNAPHAEYIHRDMSLVDFPRPCFDLVTNFWAGYCYLGSRARIEALLQRIPRWIRPKGALYVEVLLAEDLASFDASRYAEHTGFRVVPLCDDYSDWAYDDVGGRHIMHSPPVSLFLDTLAPHFGNVQAVHDGGFMVHLMATDRLP